MLCRIVFSGNILQSKSVYEFARLGFGLGFLPVTLITVPLLGIIIFGKDKLYQNFSAVFVPLMSVFLYHSHNRYNYSEYKQRAVGAAFGHNFGVWL